MEKITGKNNELIKGIKKLVSSSSERRSKGLFVLEGARLVFDVLNSVYTIKYFLITQSAYDRYAGEAAQLAAAAEKSFIISDDIAERLSDTKNSQGVFAVCSIKRLEAEIESGKYYIALDNVQDPGNLGTVIRTAEALGIDGLFISSGCDIYNPKVLRAAMGSALRLPIANTDMNALIELARSKGIPVYATVPDSNATDIEKADFTKGAVCIIGNEANGISPEVISLCDGSVTIRMRGRAESLNASVAAAITMREMLR
jgi:TrmH family RNA methyltransferase